MVAKLAFKSETFKTIYKAHATSGALDNKYNSFNSSKHIYSTNEVINDNAPVLGESETTVIQ